MSLTYGVWILFPYQGYFFYAYEYIIFIHIYK